MPFVTHCRNTLRASHFPTNGKDVFRGCRVNVESRSMSTTQTNHHHLPPCRSLTWSLLSTSTTQTMASCLLGTSKYNRPMCIALMSFLRNRPSTSIIRRTPLQCKRESAVPLVKSGTVDMLLTTIEKSTINNQQ
jgi:hypothetical protein